jgi:hypothetical protein
MARQTALPTIVPSGSPPFGSLRPACPVALPLVGAVVVVVGAAGAPGVEVAVAPVVAVVPGGRGVVVVLVSSPRRYFPSSVPPQPGATSSTAATTAVTGIIVRSANQSPPEVLWCSVRKRASLPAVAVGLARGWWRDALG